jgi:hypothetical protein
MLENEAIQHALGYAAGREDASGVKTTEPDERPGFVAFADAYAAGWAEYRAEKRSYMTNCRDAYETWQATGGITIFRNGPTLECDCVPGQVCEPCTARGYTNGLAGYAARIYPERVTQDDIDEQNRVDAQKASELAG